MTDDEKESGDSCRRLQRDILEIDPWAIVEKGFHPDRQEVSESVFSLGNEYMGVRGYFEEGYSGGGMLGSYLNGVFEEDDIHHPFAFKGMATRLTFLVNTVDWLYTRIALDGETLDLARSKISGFTRRLDLRGHACASSFGTWAKRGSSCGSFASSAWPRRGWPPNGSFSSR